MTTHAGISSFRFYIDHSLLLSRNLVFHKHVRSLQQYCSMPSVLPLFIQHAFFVPSNGHAYIDGSSLPLFQSGRCHMLFSSFSIASPGNHTLQVHDENGKLLCSQTLRCTLPLSSPIGGVCTAPDIRIDKTTYRVNGRCVWVGSYAGTSILFYLHAVSSSNEYCSDSEFSLLVTFTGTELSYFCNPLEEENVYQDSLFNFICTVSLPTDTFSFFAPFTLAMSFLCSHWAHRSTPRLSPSIASQPPVSPLLILHSQTQLFSPERISLEVICSLRVSSLCYPRTTPLFTSGTMMNTKLSILEREYFPIPSFAERSR